MGLALEQRTPLVLTLLWRGHSLMTSSPNYKGAWEMWPLLSDT